MCKSLGQKQPHRQQPNNAYEAEKKQAKERVLKEAFPVHRLPIQWTANPSIQEVINKHDERPNLRQAALTCIIIKRVLKHTFPVHTLPIQWIANLRIQEVINKHDELPNLRQVALTCIGDPIGEFHEFVDES